MFIRWASALRTDAYLIQTARTVFFHKVLDTVLEPVISPLNHSEKCVFGVFLSRTHITLVCKN